MKLKDLEAALHRQPFRQIELRVDGEVIRLHHPEQLMFAEKKSTVIVVDPDDHIHIFDHDQISKLRLLPKKAANVAA
jgi:hypothetical protein